LHARNPLPDLLDQQAVHHGGLVHWNDLPGLELTRPTAISDLLARFAGAPLLSPPGERFSYSSPGYVLLGLIIEQAARQPYGAFLTREIFEPLGLTATFNGNPSGEPDLAAGREDGVPVPSFELDTVGLATGSIWSTAGDLSRWDRALASGEILSDAARHTMLSAHVPVEDDDGLIHTEGYGYGWFDVRLAVLSNERFTDLDPIVHDLIQTAFPSTTCERGTEGS
jgi:CubicO group peptidase (beta-lactamase class C family)